MTLEEAKALAEQGHVGAMTALAEYYSKQEGDEDAINTAYYYYELAANKGDPDSILKMAQTSRMTAGVAFSMLESGRIDLMDEDIVKGYRWAKKLDGVIHDLNVQNEETVSFVRENLIVGISRLATLYYLDEKYQDLVEITRGVDHPYARAIYGLALFKQAETESAYDEAFGAMKSIENELCWKKEYQSKFGQILLVEAASYLSDLYRVVDHDVDSAYRVLAFALSHSANEAIQQDISEILEKHYRKKLFGGYTYVP